MELPEISILVPVVNEIAMLESLLFSIKCNGYPIEKMELIFLDGGSTDGTLEYLQNIAQTDSNFTVIFNSKGIVSHALNLGVNAARGTIIVRADAHAFYYPGYFELSVRELIGNPLLGSVGGRVAVVGGKSATSKAIAIALSSVMGNGGVSYRSGQNRKMVDTVWCGCWHREMVHDLGGFNEEWAVNQDYEFNVRLIRSGRRILFDPKIRADYYCRDTLSGLAKQYFRYGMGRAKTFFFYPESIKPRQMLALLPILLTIFSFFSGANLSDINRMLWVIYTFSLIVPGLQCLFGDKPKIACFQVPVILATIHIFWGCGFLVQFVAECTRFVGVRITSSTKTLAKKLFL